MNNTAEQTKDSMWPSFAKKLSDAKLSLQRRPLETLQINLGKLCNQACSHCHVEASPKKKRENISYETAARLVALAKTCSTLTTIDLTGGAPELNPHFRYLVKAFREQGKTVIDRCNLTVLHEPGQEDTAEFLRDYAVKIIASLPCYGSANVEKQRGKGVFGKSIASLQRLNGLGYGKIGSSLYLDLVYNPVGPSLPPDQTKLKADYKEKLLRDFAIEFNDLYTITNMPIKRFLADLTRQGKYDEYMHLLAANFNAVAAAGVMCRTLVSVSWDGYFYDCDFNQMLEISLPQGKRSVWDVESLDDFSQGPIALADHCYGCTAGAGSSCGGALV